MSRYVITIETDFIGGEDAVREAADKLATTIGWGDDNTTSIEVVKQAGGTDIHIASWEMEPGSQSA